MVPRESSEAVSKGVWLSPTNLYFATSPFSHPRFSPALASLPHAHPIGEEGANPGLGGRLQAGPLLSSP